MGTPEEVMSSLVFARLLESEHRRSLRIDPAEQVANNTVLPGGIKRLQDHRKGLAAVRVEQIRSFSIRST